MSLQLCALYSPRCTMIPSFFLPEARSSFRILTGTKKGCAHSWWIAKKKNLIHFSRSIPPSIWHLIKLFAIWASSTRTLCSSHDLLLQPLDPKTVFSPTSGFHPFLHFHYQLIHYSSEQYSVLPGKFWLLSDGVVTFSTEILAVRCWKRDLSLNHLVLERGT